MTSGVKYVPIGDVTVGVENWNPQQFGAQSFEYIDLSSVDQSEKKIVEARKIVGSEAPSRARQIVEIGDVLVSTVRPNLNGVARVTEEFSGATASTGFSVLRPTGKLDSGYLYHWVRSQSFVGEMVRKSTGANYPAVTDRTVRAAMIPLVDIDRQRWIADVLDRVDTLRARRRRVIAGVDALVDSVFMQAFGDLCANDRGWSTCRVGDFVAGFEAGKNVVGDDNSSDLRVLKVSSVTSGIFDPAEVKPVPAGYSPPVSHFVRSGDLLFSRANTEELVGAVALVHGCPPNLLLPDKIWRFEWRTEADALPWFAYRLFWQPSFRRVIRGRSTGTSGSMKNISQDKVLSVVVGYPPLNERLKFSRQAEHLHRIGSVQRRALGELDALFASLQHRAFRGEL
ncbi:hypothetical protein [Micromonospora sp. LOL_015]|uniref:hypothetical protein n=1 Tax=Micromonospora sp. LOL_015 TaxID=3345416 RepID=UPI003A8BEA5C